MPKGSRKESTLKAFKKLGSYDMRSARASGAIADSSGHMPSRDPRSGMLLKSPDHPTFHKSIDADRKLKLKFSTKKGRIFSNKKVPKGHKKLSQQEVDALRRRSMVKSILDEM